MRLLILISAIILPILSESIGQRGMCVGHKDISTYAEYLQAFREGPCSPVVWVPGLMGSNLRIKVDCKVFKENRKNYQEIDEILKECSFMCGWWSKSYENSIWVTDMPIWKYMLWNDYNFVFKRRECMFRLLNPKKRRIEKDGKVIFEDYDLPGMDIRVLGDTDKTADNLMCGAKAIEYIFGPDNQLYSLVLDELRKLGYVFGLTLQATPYDFRLSAFKNGFFDKLLISMKIMNAFTGKKNVVLGHSYGNNVIMNALNSYSQEVKDQLVDQYVALGPPFLGAPMALFYLLGSADWMYINKVKEYTHSTWLNSWFDGINTHYSQMSYPYIDAMYEFIPNTKAIKDQYKTLKENKQFLESDESMDQHLVKNTFGHLERTLSQTLIWRDFENTDPEKDFKSEYTMDDIPKSVEDFAMSEFTAEYYKQFPNKKTDSSSNPGVPVSLIFLQELDTMAQMKLKGDTRKEFSQKRFPKYEILNSEGDSVVSLFSFALPTLLWYTEYKKAQEGKIQDNGLNSEDETTPKIIRFFEFGQKDDYKVSENFEYIKCYDEDVITSPKTKSVNGNLVHHPLSFIGGMKTINNQLSSVFKHIKHNVKSIISKMISNKTQSTEAFDLEEEIFEAEEKLMNKNESEKTNQSLKETLFGSKSCNHSALVINRQFFDLFKRLVQEQSLKSGSDSIDNISADSELEESHQSRMDLRNISNEKFEEYIRNCPAVRCHEGVENCWVAFEEFFGMSKMTFK